MILSIKVKLYKHLEKWMKYMMIPIRFRLSKNSKLLDDLIVPFSK